MNFSFISFLKKKLTQLYTSLRSEGNGEGEGIRNYLVKRGAGSLGVRLGSIGLSFLTGVILARILGPSGLGAYSYVLAIISMLVIPTQLGLPDLLVREVSAFQTKKQWPLLKGILIRSNQFVLATSLFLVIVCALVLYVFPNVFENQVRQTFWWSLPLLILIPLAALRSSALRGLKEVILGILPEQMIKPASLIVLIGLVWIATGNNWFSPENVMILHAGAVFLAFLIGAYWLKKKLPGRISHSETVYNTRSWLKSTIPFMILGGLNIINGKIDIVLVGSLGTNQQVGLFEVANRGAAFVAISLRAINIVVAPLFSSLWARQDLEKLQKVLTRSTQAIIAFSLPVALLFMAKGEWLLQLFFGSEYTDAATALAILSAGYLFTASMGSIGLLLSMTGHERSTASGVGIAVTVNIILNIWLIPLYGIEGAAVASLVSFMIANIFYGYAVYKHLNIVPSLFYKKKSDQNG